MALPRLRIKKRDQQRLRDGHLWVYSNEIDTAQTPLRTIAAEQHGYLAHLEDYRGHFLATVSFNANALIAARILATTPLERLDSDFFVQRLQTALTLREQCFDLPYYRLVYSEGDNLAGLVIDRFNAVFVVQISTWAMESARAELVFALQQLFGADISIIFKHEGKGRQIEQLPEYIDIVGPVPSHLTIIENGVTFQASLDGQKTGWFYDHRSGRAWLNHWLATTAKHTLTGLSVLDLFSYVGGWGIQAAAYGAQQVTCIDASEKAGIELKHNSALLKQTPLPTTRPDVDIQFEAADIFSWLKNTPNLYDVVVLDPPALIQKRRDFEQGRQAYFMLNDGALARVKPGGVLITASCSLHLHRDELLKIMQQLARRQHKHLQLIHEAQPAADHPQILAMPESLYLKCFMFRVLPLEPVTT